MEDVKIHNDQIVSDIVLKKDGQVENLQPRLGAMPVETVANTRLAPGGGSAATANSSPKLTLSGNSRIVMGASASLEFTSSDGKQANLPLPEGTSIETNSAKAQNVFKGAEFEFSSTMSRGSAAVPQQEPVDRKGAEVRASRPRVRRRFHREQHGVNERRQ